MSRKRSQIPSHAIDGKVYDLTERIPKRALPRHIQFVWSGVSDEATFNRFLRAYVYWADISALASPMMDNLDQGREAAAQNDLLSGFLRRLLKENKGVRLALRSRRAAATRILNRVKGMEFDPGALWFTANVEYLRSDGFRRLTKAFPGAVIECPVDFLAPLIVNAPDAAETILDTFCEWGINRFALSWETPAVKSVLEMMDDWGFDVTIHDVKDLEAFLQSVLLVPRAIVSDFSFPKWEHDELDLEVPSRRFSA